MEKTKVSYIVWKGYQRRAEVLAAMLDAELKFMPNWFQSKSLRLLDYLGKFLATLKHILLRKPDLVIVQGPPLFTAIPALLMKVPYIIDAHNAAIQGFWQKVPMSKYIISKAHTVIVHNFEILQLAKKLFPSSNFISVLDPLEFISFPNNQRIKNQILVICSFGSDEPIDVIIDTIKTLPDYKFVITADINKIQPLQRKRICECDNVNLTGFLPTEDYHALLCSSLAVLVLTTRDSTQPSGACEALSSNTQLILSESSLTKELFGEWAILVNNSVESIVTAINSLEVKNLDLYSYRNQWNAEVQEELSNIHRSFA